MFLAKSTDWIRLPPNVLGAIISELLTRAHIDLYKQMLLGTNRRRELHRGGIHINTYLQVYRQCSTTQPASNRQPGTGTGTGTRQATAIRVFRASGFDYRASCIVYRVSCIVFRVMVASSAPMQQSGAERYLTQAYSKQEQPLNQEHLLEYMY